MCSGYTNTMRWPDKHTDVPDDFVMGSDVLKELVPVKDGVPWWECNWEGSPSVPHLGAIKQKIPNFNMWRRHTFQNCVWLGQSIPSKNRRQMLSREHCSGGLTVPCLPHQAPQNLLGGGLRPHFEPFAPTTISRPQSR